MSERLTEEQLALIEQRATAATDGIEMYLKSDGSIVECGVGGQYAPTEADVELFEHAKHYIIELLAEIRESRAALAKANDALVVEAWRAGNVVTEPWPANEPPQHNGSGSPCDVWRGSCSCGAWHDGRRVEGPPAHPVSLGDVRVVELIPEGHHGHPSTGTPHPPCPNCGATGNHSDACYREQHERAARRTVPAQLTVEEREALRAAWYDLTCFQLQNPCGECSLCIAGTSMCERPRDNCRRCVARKAIDRLIRNGGGK